MRAEHCNFRSQLNQSPGSRRGGLEARQTVQRFPAWSHYARQGITLQGGTLGFYPANNTSNVTILNSNTTGSGQIGTLDTTTLANGSYWIAMQATDTSGHTEDSLAR